MEARALSVLARAPWRVLVGPNLSQERFQRLQAAGTDGIIVERNRPDFTELLRNCRVSISQGGYNTILEVLAARARAVIVPYSDEREIEQTVRAHLLAEQGAFQVVENDMLSPARLASAVNAALQGPRPKAVQLDANGATASACIVAAAIRPAA